VNANVMKTLQAIVMQISGNLQQASVMTTIDLEQPLFLCINTNCTHFIPNCINV